MTKLAVFSDIHANLPALEAVVEDTKQFKVDQVIVAGDVISSGPFTQQVVERVAEGGWSVIQGNGELFLLDYGTPRAPKEWNDPKAYPIPPWLNRQLGSHWKTIIAGWPKELRLNFSDAPSLRLFHGSPKSAWDSLYPGLTDQEIEGFLRGVEENTVISGHTHLALDKNSGPWHLLNPGSVGVPLDGQFSAGYMLIEGDEEGWQSTFRRVPFDYESLFREFERIGFVEECGIIGQLCVDVFKTARPGIVSFWRWKGIHYPNESLSQEMYDEYSVKCKWWEYSDKAYLINMAE